MWNKSEQHIHKQIFNEISIESFRLRLWEIKWDNLLTSNHTNLAYNKFLDTFPSLCDDCFPRVKIRVKARNPFRPLSIIHYSKALQYLLGKKNYAKNI